MNNMFFVESNEAPRPREEVEILELTAEPYPDSPRVRMGLKITPFLERPNIEIYAKKVDGPIVAEMSVIETMTPQLEFTLHIRGVEDIFGDYILRAELFYDDRTKPQHSMDTSFSIRQSD